MFHPHEYLSALTRLLCADFGERLVYVGLQGSYLRGEATEHSDIDVMVVVRGLTPADLAAYRRAVEALPDAAKSCGFICGLEELQHWNPLEICHVLHTTRDFFGTLSELLLPFSAQDVLRFVQMSVGNLYHEICHRYVHAPRECSIDALPGTYRGVFFILQNLHYLRTGCFIGTKKELLEALSGQDRDVLETAMTLADGDGYDFDAAFARLLAWCRETLINI